MKCFIGSDAFRGIALEEAVQKGDGFFFFVAEFLLGGSLVAAGAAGAPKDDFLQSVAVFAVAGDVGLKNLAVQEGRLAHLLAAKDGSDFE